MFAIVDKMIFLVSFEVRLVHARTSVVFSDLVFFNFNFCLCKFKGMLTPQKTQEFLKILHHFCMQNLSISLLIPPKLLFVFSTKLFSILKFTVSCRFRTAATSEMELFCDSSDDLKWLAVVANSSTIYVVVRWLVTAFFVCDPSLFF